MAKKFDDIVDEMKRIHEIKSHDYGNAYSDALDFSGGYGHATGMMFHKLDRFKNLINCQDKSKVKDESIDDTLIDLANYAILTLEHIYKKREPKSNRYIFGGQIEE